MIKTTHDGRTIRSGTDYTKFRKAVWARQSFLCNSCGRYTDFQYFDVHHKAGRGLGGSKRDDILVEVEGLCRPCHKGEHGQ